MIKFNDATSMQKKITLLLLGSVLKLFGATDHYRIENSGRPMIRESSTNPPSPENSRLFQRQLEGLRHLITFSIGTAQVRRGLFDASDVIVFAIEEINEREIDNAIALLGFAGGKDANLDNLLKSRLPAEILARWDRFSPALQAHLLNCVKIDLTHLLQGASETAIGATFLSPVGFEAPSFPVRLPLPAGSAEVADPKADVNKVYDILEILNITQRDPHDPTRRRHPITREYFSLNDVLPAPDALEKLKARAEAGAAAGAARGGAGGGGIAPRR